MIRGMGCAMAMVGSAAAVSLDSTLDLVSEEGFNVLTITVNPGVLPADTDQSTLTGELSARLEIDAAAGTASELTFTGGQVNGTDTAFSGSAFLVGSYNLTVSGLGGEVVTPEPPGVVAPATGEFAADQHEVIIDEGAVAGSADVSLVGQIVIDETFTGDDPLSGAASGTGTVTLVPGDFTASGRVFEVAVTIPVDIERATEESGQTITVTATGTIKAVDTVEVPLDPYTLWTQANGRLGIPFAGDVNGDGISNGLAWALGHDAPTGDASGSRPEVLGDFAVEFAAAAGGTVAPLTVEVSTDLGEWNPVPAERLSTGLNPVPAGTRGTVRISPSGGGREFLRVRAGEP